MIEAAVVRALGQSGADRAGWEFIETGSSNLVVLAGDVAVRIARDPRSSVELRRTQGLIDRLPDLSFAVPRSLGPVVEHEGLAAVPTRRLVGTPHPARSGDPVRLRNLLDAVHSIDVSPLREWLARPRAFCGGPDWLRVMREQVIPRLPEDVRGEASERVSALATLDTPGLVLNHGDLAGSNVLWDGGRVTGVLDWDLAAEDDPAEDVASLAGWHGWDLAAQLADPDTVARAETFRRSFPLQVIAFALSHDRPAPEVERAIQRALPKLRDTTD
nr:phosphotransferase [Allobranchiibius sp. GilTou38]